MTRSRVIAVASAKGSPGCSFVALGLAGRLAEAGIETLLVDADAEAGSLAGALDLAQPEAGVPIAGLGPVSEAAVAGAVRPAASKLHCLDLSGEAVEVDGRQLADIGRQRYPAVVVDLGHRPGRLQRELVACSDWLLWVVAPDRSGFERADRALGGAELPRVSAGIVLNRLGVDRLADAGRVLAERHRLPLLARLPESPGGARAAARRCQGPQRVREFRRQFAELARCLHPDVGGGGGDRWP
jgi:Mrp family chromosome partitioning ATPase